MANHKSSVKRIRQTASRRLHNRYYAKTMRNAVRKLRATTDKAAAVELLHRITDLVYAIEDAGQTGQKKHHP